MRKEHGMTTTIPNGAPAWADSVSHEFERDLAFYTGLFDWSPLDFGEEVLHYVDFHLGEPGPGGRAVAGLIGSSPMFLPDAPSRWTAYFRVPDCEHAVERATALGAALVIGASPVGDGLVYALMEDPAGAHFGCFEIRSDTAGFQASGEPGAPIWFEYAATDLSAPVEFYRQLLGWTVGAPEPTGAGEPLAWASFTAPGAGAEFGGSHRIDDGEDAGWTVFYQVRHVEQAAGRAAELGGAVATAPYDVTGYRLAELTAPSGARFGIAEPR
jgi:predicted enzyme related to lactoylglutathione lyase